MTKAKEMRELTLGIDVDANGNVGIGTDSASELLHANGNIRLTTNVSTTRRLYALSGTGPYALNSSGGAAIAFHRDATNNDEIAFETHWQGNQHAERMRIDNQGNVGIGETSPAGKLEVQNTSVNYAILGTSNKGHYFESQSDDNTDGFEIYQQHGSTASRNSFIVNDNRTGSKSAAFAVRGNGRIGIGTDSPTALLDVSDSTSNEPQIRLTTATATNYLSIARDSSTGHYEFKSEENGSAISFHTDPDGTGSQNRLLIDRYGQTVIGEYDVANGYTPYGQLTVRKNVDNGTVASTDVSDLDDATLVIHNQDSAGTGNKAALVFAHAGSPGIPSAIVSTKQNGNWRTHLSFYTNNITGGASTGVMQEQMRIDHDGNVGINSATPVSKLDVQYGTLGTWEGASSTPTFVVGQTDAYRGISLRTVGNSNVGPSFHFERTRASGGTTSDNDKLGQIVFNGSSGGYVNRVTAAIDVIQDGTAAAGWVPGTIQFKTTSVASSSTNEHVPRMTIKTDGNIEFTNNGNRSQHISYKDYAYYFDYQPGKQTWTDTTEAGNNSLTHALMVRTPVRDSSNVAAIVIAENGGQASGKNGLWFRNEDFNSGGGFTKAKIYTEVGGNYTATSFYIDVATSSQNSAQRLQIDHNGTFYGSSSNNISDRRLKENIETITNPIEKIKGLTGRTFMWTEESTKADGKTKYGFIAQEVDTVVPDLVEKQTGLTYFDDNDNIVEKHESTNAAMSINETGVIPILVEALKEALTQIDDLKARIEALEG